LLYLPDWRRRQIYHQLCEISLWINGVALDSLAIDNGLPLPTFAAVPEPACVGLIAMAGLGAFVRRRRR
jgi:hypothetical protein